ncbi:hypothetical protein [Acinetobacter lactucae]|nr:hypothetical protein [Acinetobacter lactucae]
MVVLVPDLLPVDSNVLVVHHLVGAPVAGVVVAGCAGAGHVDG